MNSPWYKIDLSKTSGLCLKAAVIVLLLASIPLYLTIQGFDWYAGLDSFNEFVIERAAYVNVLLFGLHLWGYLVYGSLREKRINNGLTTFLFWARIPAWIVLCTVVFMQVAVSEDVPNNCLLTVILGVIYAAMLEYSLVPKNRR